METRSFKRLRVLEERKSKVDRLSLLPTVLQQGVFEFLDPRSHVRLGWATKDLRQVSLDEHSWCWRHRVLESIGLYSASRIGANWAKARDLIAAAPVDCAERLFCHGEYLMATVDYTYENGVYNFKQALAEYKKAADLGHFWARFRCARLVADADPFDPMRHQDAETQALVPELVERAARDDLAARKALFDLELDSLWVNFAPVRAAPLIARERSIYGANKSGPEQLVYQAERKIASHSWPYADSIRLFKEAAEMGLVHAWSRAGDCHRWSREFGSAHECYKKAAAAGHLESMHAVACQEMYSTDEPEAKVVNDGLETMKKAAEFGLVEACRRMLNIYTVGWRHVERDPVLEARYLDLVTKLHGGEEEEEEEEYEEDEDEEWEESDGDDNPVAAPAVVAATAAAAV